MCYPVIAMNGADYPIKSAIAAIFPRFRQARLLPCLHNRGMVIASVTENSNPMSIVKVIEVIASSEKGIEDALQQAVAEASKTVRNIDSVYVKDIKAHVQDGKISSYGLICKISFRLDENSKADTDTTAKAAEKPEQQLPQVPREETTAAAKGEEKVPENEEEAVSEPVNQKDFVPAH